MREFYFKKKESERWNLDAKVHEYTLFLSILNRYIKETVTEEEASLSIEMEAEDARPYDNSQRCFCRENLKKYIYNVAPDWTRASPRHQSGFDRDSTSRADLP